MQRRNIIQRLFLNNWKPKLICLVCAVVVWLLVNHLLVRGDSPEWDIDDIRISKPE
ncbi:MAG: hypothetical protein IJE66_04340 [Akkermansia sp.]|nr:hypothetical protein [Akkermansia sp.]